VRILVVDDHPLMAEALRSAAKELVSKAQVETASDLDGAFQLAGTKPDFDLVMLDLGLPGCSGMQALERFREHLPNLPVVVVTAVSDRQSVITAVDRGAMGFIPKTSPRNVLLHAIKIILSGGIYLPPEVRQPSVAEADGVPAARAETAPRREADLGLSPRQREVLSLLLKGLPNKLIARQLDISENTTKIHVSAVLQALGASSRTKAVIKASELGLRLGAPQ
jgi:DNA-binding NarL/FixJ family response regulator